ncbi:MAG: hypothetical protein JJ921_19025, partial [Pseudomonadales bacterium]|nr:hypothetical protein [Pseudomonadales bacterium]
DLGGDVTTTTTQTYGGAVTLSGGTRTLAGTTVTFNNTLDGAQALQVTGNAAFNGRVGGTTDLTSITVTGNASLNNDIDTTGIQHYGNDATADVVTLATNVALVGSTITFTSDIQGTVGTETLGITGNVDFDGEVGDFNSSGDTVIDDLTVSGNLLFDGTIDNVADVLAGSATINGQVVADSFNVTGNTTLAANVTTTTTQTYGDAGADATTLGAGVTLTGSIVTFNSALDGSEALVVTGAAVFNGRVGGLTDLDAITVSGGATTLNNDIDTTGNQTYTATTLGGDVTL